MPHRVVEIALLTMLVVWSAGSVVFAASARGRRALDRFNHGLWWANWTVFGSGRNRAEIQVFALEYRDRTGATTGPWREVIRGRPWTWHAFLWQPGRRLADRIHRIGQDIARAQESGTPMSAWAEERCRVLARHLAATRPLAADATREIRLRVWRSTIDHTSSREPQARVDERVVFNFAADGAGHDV